MTEPPLVRPGDPGDAAAVGAVQAASWREGYAGLLPTEVLTGLDPEALADVWRRSLEKPPSSRHRLLVACAGPRVVGFAALGPSEDPDAEADVAELLVLAVHPGARRGGHGSRLLSAAADTARGDGAAVLVVWVPREDEATRRFLQTAGFGPDSAWRDRVVEEPGRCLREVRLVAGLPADDEQRR